MKLTKIALLFAALGLGCSAVYANDFDTALAAADAKRKEAAAVGHEWRDTGKLLEEAQKAADEGDMDKAMKLAAKAEEQSSDAIAQQAREATAWMSRVPQ